MINVALNFIREYLDQTLTAYGVTGLGNVKVVNISKADNSTGTADGDINITLLHIEEERMVKEPYVLRRSTITPGHIDVLNPEVKLNVYVIISSEESTASDYLGALMRLSYVIVAFQEKNYFTQAEITSYITTDNDFSFTGTTAGTYVLERITCDLNTLTLDQGSNLWQAIRGKMMPYVVYKLRLVALRHDAPLKSGPEILEVSINANGS